MRIAAINTYALDVQLDVPFESASGRFDHRQHGLVEIICEDGITGWGECLGPVRPNLAMVRAYAELLIGKDPLNTDVRWLELYHAFRDQGQRGTALTAISGIDIALWDIKGKHFKAPISVLLGGRFCESVEAYATGGFRLVGRDRISTLIDEAAGYVAEGFQRLKMKIGFGEKEDLAAIAAVRETIGADVRLMIDANHGYDALEAIAVGRAATRYTIDWFEEPVLPEVLAAYVRVRKEQPVPVAGGETWQGHYAMHQALQAGAVDILQPDVCGSGGFTEMRRIFDLAEVAGVRVVPHVWGSGVALAASLQCLASLAPNPPRRREYKPLLEFDRTSNPCRQAILTTPIEHDQGVVNVPAGPGLGITVDRAALTRFAMDKENE